MPGWHRLFLFLWGQTCPAWYISCTQSCPFQLMLLVRFLCTVSIHINSTNFQLYFALVTLIQDAKKHRLPTVRRLKVPFIKYESTNRIYRPMKKEFEAGFPKLNLSSAQGVPPFGISAAVRTHNNQAVDLEAHAERGGEGDTNEQQQELDLLQKEMANSNQNNSNNSRHVCNMRPKVYGKRKTR